MAERRSARFHLAAVARVGFGAALLARPARIVDAAAGEPVEEGHWVAAARVLGIRHLVEAIAVNIRPSPTFARLGAGVDAIHACTAGGFALADRPRRRLLGVNACVAAAFALAGAHHARALGRRNGEIGGR